MRDKEKSTTIYFIRHGQTDFPLDRIYCDDKEDPGLNQNGIYQAKSTSLYFKNVNLSAIYSSPALRAKMTANEISQITGLDIRPANAWVERKFGQWEGMYFHEIEEKYPDDYTSWKRDKVNFTPQNGETIDDVKHRLVNDLSRLIEAHSGENIALVSHVGPIRIITCAALSIPLSSYRQLRVDYASINRIDFGQTMNNLATLNYFNY